MCIRNRNYYYYSNNNHKVNRKPLPSADNKPIRVRKSFYEVGGGGHQRCVINGIKNRRKGEKRLLLIGYCRNADVSRFADVTRNYYYLLLLLLNIYYSIFELLPTVL